MLKIKVKVGKVTDLSDARYCSGMGVDLLGFPVGSHDGIDPKKYKEITDWVSGPSFVLEWTGEEITDRFEEVIQAYNADFIQIAAHQLENIPLLPKGLIVTLPVSDWPLYHLALQSNKSKIAYLLLTNSVNDLIDSTLVGQIAKEFPVLLGFGIAEKNLDLIESLPVAGIALDGTTEFKPGLKDYSYLSAILERLEVM